MSPLMKKLPPENMLSSLSLMKAYALISSLSKTAAIISAKSGEKIPNGRSSIKPTLRMSPSMPQKSWQSGTMLSLSRTAKNK